MSYELADLMLRNLQEVFNERDPARRIGAVKSIYAKEAEFFEGDEHIKGHDAISAKVSALQASFPPDFTFSPTGAPASNHDLGRLTWRVGPAGGSPAATGMDVAVFERGRIRALYTFLDDVVRPLRPKERKQWDTKSGAEPACGRSRSLNRKDNKYAQKRFYAR